LWRHAQAVATLKPEGESAVAQAVDVGEADRRKTFAQVRVAVFAARTNGGAATRITTTGSGWRLAGEPLLVLFIWIAVKRFIKYSGSCLMRSK
jgi:hypothetical protein